MFLFFGVSLFFNPYFVVYIQWKFWWVCTDVQAHLILYWLQIWLETFSFNSTWWVILHALFDVCWFFEKITFHTIIIFLEYHQSFKQFMIQISPQHNVGPDLDPNCLQRLSAEDKSCNWQVKTKPVHKKIPITKLYVLLVLLLPFNPYPAKTIAKKMLSAYYVCCIFSNELQTTLITFIMKAKNMNPDQTAPKGAVWSGFIFFAV